MDHAVAFERMVAQVRTVLRRGGFTHPAARGTSWAGHVAIAIALTDDLVPASNLTLHLAADYIPASNKRDAFEGSEAGRALNAAHGAFSGLVGWNSLAQVGRAIRAGATVQLHTRSAKAGDNALGRGCTGLIAFTRGRGEHWKGQSFADSPRPQRRAFFRETPAQSTHGTPARLTRRSTSQSTDRGGRGSGPSPPSWRRARSSCKDTPRRSQAPRGPRPSHRILALSHASASGQKRLARAGQQQPASRAGHAREGGAVSLRSQGPRAPRPSQHRSAHSHA